MEDTMTPGHRLWKKSILTGDALCAAWWPCPPFTWNSNSLALNLYFDLDNTPWVKCDKCHTPFHLQCGTWESLALVRNKRFLCIFSAAENFRSTCRPMSLDYPSPCPPSSIVLAFLETLSENTCRFTSVSLVLKMAWKQLCPDNLNGTPAKKQKKQPGSSAKDTDHAKIKRHRSS